MTWRSVASVLALTAMGGGSLACEETRCRELSAYPLDEAGTCLRPSRSIPELPACTAHPPTRGVRTICLVDASGQLFLATTGDSERVSGSGWRYSGGAGAQALTEPETQRCAAAMSEIGFPEPRKECSISDGGAASDGGPTRDGGATTDTDVNRDRPTTDGAVIESFEGHYCSMSPEDAPQSQCSPRFDFLCIATYSERVSGDGGSYDARIPLCRIRCVPGGPACLSRGDVCCMGQTAGGGTEYACVPPSKCESMDAAAGS